MSHRQIVRRAERMRPTPPPPPPVVVDLTALASRFNERAGRVR